MDDSAEWRTRNLCHLSGLSEGLRHSLARSQDELNILYKTYVQLHVEFCIQTWSPYLEKDVGCLKRVQKRATKMVHGLKDLKYEARLKRLGFCSLWRRWLQWDLIETFNILTGRECIDKSQFFSVSYHKPERPRPEAIQSKITSSGTSEILQPADRWHLDQVAAGSVEIDIHQHVQESTGRLLEWCGH